MIDCFNPPSRPSFSEAISRAERQVSYWEMRAESDKLAHQLNMDLVHELCAIMAEVYMMSPDRQIRISGEMLEVYIVQQVFGELTQEHVRQVVSDFSRLCYEITNKKAYLRAMLYNSVFSLQASVRNESNSH